ncbi:MAG: hypothetical protein ACYDA4_15225 [Ignavibacteriaceae bacterium]
MRKIGEQLFINFLIRNKICFTDLRNSITYKKIESINHINNHYYTYIQKLYSHPFDFIVNDKNIEIKTSTIHKWDNRIIFSWESNDSKNINYVVGLVINSAKTIKEIFLFDNKYINSHKGFGATYNSKYLPIIDKKEFIKLLTV